MSIFKDFKLNIVINIVYRRKVDSLTPLLLAFINLLTYICYAVLYSAYVAGRKGLVAVHKGG